MKCAEYLKRRRALCFLFFFFNDPPPTKIYPLPLPDPLQISAIFLFPTTATKYFFTIMRLKNFFSVVFKVKSLPRFFWSDPSPSSSPWEKRNRRSLWERIE